MLRQPDAYFSRRNAEVLASMRVSAPVRPTWSSARIGFPRLLSGESISPLGGSDDTTSKTRERSLSLCVHAPIEADRSFPFPLALDRGFPGVLRGLSDLHRRGRDGNVAPYRFR